ncbi:MAG: hypothetical protein NVS9B10_09280 [Nevskia sp.]
MTENKPEVGRRNFRTALVLFLVALGFYVAFFFAVSHRGH